MPERHTWPLWSRLLLALASGLLTAAAVVGVAWFGMSLLGGESKHPFLPHIDTRFAPGFTFDGWERVALGGSVEDALAMLGEPRKRFDPWRPGTVGIEEMWSYTGDGKCTWGDFAWHDLQLGIADGHVVAKLDAWRHD